MKKLKGIEPTTLGFKTLPLCQEGIQLLLKDFSWVNLGALLFSHKIAYYILGTVGSSTTQEDQVKCFAAKSLLAKI